MRSKFKSWDETGLWQLIQEREQEAEPVRQLLKNVMPEIETVLAKGATSPVDFTLHDEEHAFRVAERVIELLPPDLAADLTPFELALLLLSAYLHDIGMTPTRDVVKAHYHYILTKADGLLSDAEGKELQHWLDEAHDGLELPVSKGVTTVAGLEKAEELLAYYCRHRHNDWSAAWIRKHLTKAKPALYPGWVEDLVNLCRSHHEGLEALQQPRFHAGYRGSPAQVVNLRYLAALLRVADVMEFDPERTPDVIIAHRDIAPKSRVFWHKDRFSFLVDRDMREFRLDAITPNAKVHRAVLETVQQVDQELLTCNALASSGAFRLGSFEDKRCSWPWPAKVNAKASEDGSFVYIDGAFRPEPQHILKLLGGVELYRDPMVAVRELLQNALDAVKEQIARERLRLDNPGDANWEQRLGELHKVTFSVAEAEDGVWLTCEDDGVGMTRAIIERHLMVSGAPTLPEVHQLERQANACGFSVERSGRFGIGVLAYFMLAERMIINTRRSELAGGDPANIAWRFETDGLASFGQLTRSNRRASGTNVRLLIKPDQLSAGLDEWVSRLLGYVASTLVHSPCRVQLELPGRETMSLGPGWCRHLETLLASTLSAFDPRRRDEGHSRLVPAAEHIRKQEEEQAERMLRSAARDRLRWHGPIEGRLPQNSGRFRLMIPYFEYPHGISLAYFHAVASGWRKPRERHGVALKSSVKYSWRGFSVEPSKSLPTMRLPLALGAAIEIDWSSGVRILIDKSGIDLDEDAAQLLKCHHTVATCLREQMTELTSRFGIFSGVNASILSKPAVAHKEGWISEARCAPGEFELVRLRPPSVTLSVRSPNAQRLMWNGRCVSIWRPLELSAGGNTALVITPIITEGTKRIVFVEIDKAIVPVALIIDLNNPTASDLEIGVDFPIEWSLVVGIKTTDQSVLNGSHRLCRLFGERDRRWVRKHVADGDPTGKEEHILAEVGRMAAWVATNVFRNALFWNAVGEHCRVFFTRVLEDLESDGVPLPLRCIHWSSGGISGHVISPQGFCARDTTNDASMRRIDFPDALSLALPSGEEWWLHTGGKTD